MSDEGENYLKYFELGMINIKRDRYSNGIKIH